MPVLCCSWFHEMKHYAQIYAAHSLNADALILHHLWHTLALE